MDLYRWNPTSTAQIENSGLEHVPGSRVQSLQRSCSHKLKLVLLHLPSSLHMMCLLCYSNLLFCTDSLSFWEGPGEEGMHVLDCANGSPVYLLPKSRGCLHSAHTCTHSSVLLDSKLECLTQVELHKGH